MKKSVAYSRSDLLQLIKGLFVSVLVTLVAILIFAFIIKTVGISGNLIKPINQIIKFVSILTGVNSGLKNMGNKNIFKGAIMGIGYTLLAFTIFNLINGSFEIDASLLTDVCFGGIAGLISAIVSKILAK